VIIRAVLALCCVVSLVGLSRHTQVPERVKEKERPERGGVIKYGVGSLRGRDF